MNKSQISGDSRMTFVLPMPTKGKKIEMPKDKTHEKVIEEGAVELDFKENTPEILKALERQNSKGIEH